MDLSNYEKEETSLFFTCSTGGLRIGIYEFHPKEEVGMKII